MKDSPWSSLRLSRTVSCAVVALSPNVHHTFDRVWPQEGPGDEVISPWLCDFLNESLTGQCIGWGCATTPSPLPWWPCSPNLSTPDNSLCTNSVLRVIITDTCISWTLWIPWKRSQRMWWHVKLCEDHKGFPQGSAGSIQCGQEEINK